MTKDPFAVSRINGIHKIILPLSGLMHKQKRQLVDILKTIRSLVRSFYRGK